MYSADEVAKISAWLDAELAARGTGNTSARDKLLQTWSGCMNQADWDAAGVAQAWAQKTTNDTNTACQQCHPNGQGWLANADSARVFNILTTAPNPKGGWFLEYYFTVDTTDPANPKMAINTGLLTRASTGTAQHERFDLNTDRNGAKPPAMTKLQTFFDKTAARMAAGTCDPPRLAAQ
jgi:hypothetical protein